MLLRSPGGFLLCLTTGAGEGRPATQVRGGEPDLLDQVCLDIPDSRYDTETSFWAALTGWELRPGARPELRYLARPDGIPVRLLLQRTGDPVGGAGSDASVTAHVDLACADRAASTRAHEQAGARVVAVQADWTVLRDPVGRVYCLTDRDPEPGTLGMAR